MQCLLFFSIVNRVRVVGGWMHPGFWDIFYSSVERDTLTCCNQTLIVFRVFSFPRNSDFYMQLDHMVVVGRCWSFFYIILLYDYETWELLNWLQFSDLQWHSPTSMILDKQYMLGYNMQLEKKKKSRKTPTPTASTANTKSQLIKFGLAFDKVHHTHLLWMTNAVARCARVLFFFFLCVC